MFGRIDFYIMQMYVYGYQNLKTLFTTIDTKVSQACNAFCILYFVSYIMCVSISKYRYNKSINTNNGPQVNLYFYFL